MRPFRLLLASVLVVGLAGCAPTMLQTEARRVNMEPKDYQRLLDKANGDNAGAAEKLARLWYGEDNSKAAYWVEVAAKNGSHRAARLAKAVEHPPQ